MKVQFALIVALLLAAWPLRAAVDADDRYLQIYMKIEEADAFLVGGQGRAALTRYREALTDLRALQQAKPDWNPVVLRFRLDYLDKRVRELSAQFPEPTAVRTNAPPVKAPPPEAVRPTVPAGSADLMKAMQDEINRLTQENNTLQAKLKEALSVQPAAADPQEFAKAQERIQALLKERDLLKVSLEQAKAQPGPAAATVSVADLTALAAAQQKLAEQTAALNKIKEENESLQRQLAEARNRPTTAAPTTTVPGESEAVREQVASLQQSNRMLFAELTLLEQQLAMANRPSANVKADARAKPPPTEKEVSKQLAKANDNIKALERQRDRLESKIADLQKELKAKMPPDSAARIDELNRQMAVARARLEAYEAKPVPFSQEELALFRRTPVKATLSVTNLAKKRTPDLPRGSGPLMADAMRAVDAKRLDEAEIKLKQVLAQDENNVYVLNRLASVLFEQDKVAEAESYLKRALQKEPEDPASLYVLGTLRLSQSKFDEALDHLSLAAKINSEHPQTQFNLGLALVQKGNRSAAETAFRRAVALKPNWSDAHYQLAVLYATQSPEYHELARWHYQKAIAGGMGRNLELEQKFGPRTVEKP